MALNVWMQASSALTPAHGSAEACAALPRHSKAAPAYAQQILVEDVPVEAVDHHGAVHVLKDTALDQLHLSAAALLGWRADHLDAAGRQRVPHRGEGRARSGARRRDDVVPARMPDAGQRVVLAQDGDGRARAGLDRRAKRGVDARHAPLDLEALRGEEIRKPARGLDLLEAELGVGVNPVR